MRKDEIARALVLLYASRNAHSFVNYSLSLKSVDKLTRVPAAKAEVVSTLRRLADHIERDFPGYPGVRNDHEWDADPAHEGACRKCKGAYADVYLTPCFLGGIAVKETPDAS